MFRHRQMEILGSSKSNQMSYKANSPSMAEASVEFEYPSNF